MSYAGTPDLEMLEDLGSHIPRITLRAFLDHLAPPQPEFDIDVTMEMLKAYPNDILTSSGRWKAFDTEPKDQLGEEDVVFRPIQDIFKTVVDAIIANSESELTADNYSVDFLQNPMMTSVPTNRCNASRPDGYMLVKDRLHGETVSFADILLSCEYKQKEGFEEFDDVIIYLLAERILCRTLIRISRVRFEGVVFERCLIKESRSSG